MTEGFTRLYRKPRAERKIYPFVHLSIYPPSQKATGVNPWMNARRVTLRSLAAFAEASAAHRSLGGGWGEGGYASAGSAEVKWGPRL